jgi:hypothetical protein
VVNRCFLPVIGSTTRTSECHPARQKACTQISAGGSAGGSSSLPLPTAPSGWRRRSISSTDRQARSGTGNGCAPQPSHWSAPPESCRSHTSSSGGVGSPDPTPRLGSGRSGPLDLLLAAGSGRTVSLISSLIHVRVLGSITVYHRSLSRVNRQSWSVMDGHP